MQSFDRASAGILISSRRDEIPSLQGWLINLRIDRIPYGIYRFACPLRCLQDLWYTDSTIFIRIHQVQRLAVKVQTSCWTTERRPQLRVKLVKIGNIFTRAYRNLIKSAGSEETPTVARFVCLAPIHRMLLHLFQFSKR